MDGEGLHRTCFLRLDAYQGFHGGGIVEWDHHKEVETMITKRKNQYMKRSLVALATAVGIVAASPLTAFAHCDTMEGPTVGDGKKAMANNNVNYVLKWVQPQYADEITDKFELSMKVKDLSPEAKELSEQYFFSELVRLHRAGENAPFDGLKPEGTPVDEKVQAADDSIAQGNLEPLKEMVEEEKMAELTERFEKVMALKDFDVNDVEAGREYIEAYVQFFKFAEGEEEGHETGVLQGDADSRAVEEPEEKSTLVGKATLSWLPWSLAGVFFATTVIAHQKHRKHSK